MNAIIKPISLVNENATNILINEIGVVDTIRFINQFSSGHGNYTDKAKATKPRLTPFCVPMSIKCANRTTRTLARCRRPETMQVVSSARWDF